MSAVRIRAAALLLLLATAALAAPPIPDSDDARAMAGFESWINDQRGPLGLCCSISDGRPVSAHEIRIRDGHYEVLYAKRHWPEGNNVSWLPVPQEAILPGVSPLGMPVVWIYRGVVRCFVNAGAV